MRKMLEAFEKYNVWITIFLLTCFGAFEFIYRIGIIDDVGFSLAFAHIVTIFIFLLIVGSMIMAILYKKHNYLKVTGLALLGHYLLKTFSRFTTVFDYLSVINEWSSILAGVFMLISSILLVVVTAFYLITTFFDKYHFLNKYSIIILLLNIITSVLAFSMLLTSNARIGRAWYLNFDYATNYLVAPLLAFFGVLYLFPKVNALDDAIIGEVVDIEE